MTMVLRPPRKISEVYCTGAGRGKGSVPVGGCMGRLAGRRGQHAGAGEDASSLAMALPPCHRSLPRPALEHPPHLIHGTLGVGHIRHILDHHHVVRVLAGAAGRWGQGLGCSAGPATGRGAEAAQQAAMQRLPDACGLGAQDTPCQQQGCTHP